VFCRILKTYQLQLIQERVSYAILFIQLQRLANDSNPAVAAAASKAINELERQWELEEGDNLTFKMNQRVELKDGDESDWDSYTNQ
jgi:hypothetical protein